MVVAGGLLEPELRAPERRAELGDQLLGAVGPITEPAREIPAEPVAVTGPVDVLVRSGRVEVGRLVELPERAGRRMRSSAGT